MAMDEREIDVLEKLSNSIESLASSQETRATQARQQVAETTRQVAPRPARRERERGSRRDSSGNVFSQALGSVTRALNKLSGAYREFIGDPSEKYKTTTQQSLSTATKIAEEAYRAGSPLSPTQQISLAKAVQNENERIFDQKRRMEDALDTGSFITRATGTAGIIREARKFGEDLYLNPGQGFAEAATIINRFYNGGE